MACKRYQLRSVFMLALSIFSLISRAQQGEYVYTGRIEYERRFNVHSVIDPAASWGKDYKLTHDQFRVMKFNLDFNAHQMAYYPAEGQIDESIKDGLTGLPAQSNTVFSDLMTGKTITSKRVYEINYLVEDIARPIQWKLTNEKRIIAGFECKRANGVIMDSVYVVAFYSESIVPESGPEGFYGLPGMILGLAIPDLHMTWFATNISLSNITDPLSKKPTTGKKTTVPGLKKELEGVFASKGKFASIYTTSALL